MTSGAETLPDEDQTFTTLQERKGTSQRLGLIFIYMIISHQLQYTYLSTTGTQIIQVLNVCFTVFFVVFFNLTCMLKKSQSWGLSSDLEDKKDRAAGLDQSQPSVIFLIHISLHLNRVHGSKRSRQSF